MAAKSPAKPTKPAAPTQPAALTKTEVAQRLFDAFNARDSDGVLAQLAPDIVFEPVSGAVLNGAPYRGHDGMLRYFADVHEHWLELTVKPVRLREAGTAVVALGHVSGRSAGGTLDNAPTTWVFKFDPHGLVAQIQIFSDERLARAALGV
jgi:ketosteroid isomerase-like protein